MTQAEDAQPCTHHWVIETPRGPTMTGVCKHCHATRVWDAVPTFQPKSAGHGHYADRVKRGHIRDREILAMLRNMHGIG